MKSIDVTIGAVLAILFAMAVLADAALQNPSFEMPDNPEEYTCDRAAAWGRWGHWINRETGWSPTRSGNCLLGYHHFRIEEQDTSGVYQDVGDIPAGRRCTFKVNVFKDEGTDVADVELRLEPFNGGEALASTHYDMDSLPAGTWRQLQVSAKNDAEGVRVLIILTPGTSHERSGALKFDDAELAAN